MRICAKNRTNDYYIQNSNNPIVDVLRSVQKLQVWNTYIPVEIEVFKKIQKQKCMRLKIP